MDWVADIGRLEEMKARFSGMRLEAVEVQNGMVELMLELEPYDEDAGPKGPAGIAMLIDLLKAFASAASSGVWSWAMHF